MLQVGEHNSPLRDRKNVVNRMGFTQDNVTCNLAVYFVKPGNTLHRWA